MLQLRKGGHRELEKYYPLMEIDFHAAELLTKLSIHKAMLSDRQELLVMYDDETGEDIGYALVFVNGLYGYVLLKYMAIVPWCRGNGLGAELMRLVHRRYAKTKGILAELTELTKDRQGRKKLSGFLCRFGYVPVEAGYKISGTEAKLWVKPIEGTGEIGFVAHRIISDLYSGCLSSFAMNGMIHIRPIKK